MSATTSCSKLIRIGCEYIKKAKEKEEEHKYDEAVSLYAKGIKNFLDASKRDEIKNKEQIKSKLREKISTFLTRAEHIKKKIGVEQNEETYLYPTHEEIQKAKKDSTQTTICALHGYVRQISSSLNVTYDIPSGIIDLLIVYFHIPIVKSPIEKCINVNENPNIKWDDVIGLESAKETLKEQVILPMKFPQLFKDKRWPRCAVLLFGPAGCGKTYLSNAISSELGRDFGTTGKGECTFIRVNLFNIMPNYGSYNDGEHFFRDLFQYAKEKGTSVIVIDEIDCLYPENQDEDTRQSLRRVATEFQVQMMHSAKGRFIVIGITNCPWNLSHVFRRRFERRIYCGLPDENARADLFRLKLQKTEHSLTDDDFNTLAQRTNGFSGADISAVVQGALMNPVRKLQRAKYLKRVDDGNGFKWIVCDALDDGAMEMTIMDIPEDEQSEVVVDNVSMQDFEQELANYRPSITDDELQRHLQWKEDFCDDI